MVQHSVSKHVLAASLFAALLLAGCGARDPRALDAPDDANVAAPPSEPVAPTAPSSVAASVARHTSVAVTLEGKRQHSDTPFGALTLESVTRDVPELLANGKPVNVVMMGFARPASTLPGGVLAIDNASTGAVGGALGALPRHEGSYVAYAVSQDVESVVVFLDNTLDEMETSLRGEHVVYVFDWASEAWFESRLWRGDDGVTLAPLRAVDGERIVFQVAYQDPEAAPTARLCTSNASC